MQRQSEVILAIDPGSQGGYAVCLGGLRNITLHNLQSNADFVDHLLALEEAHKGLLHAVLENPPPYIAGKNVPSHTSFKLGRNCGFLEGVLRGRRIPVELVSPKKWQAGLQGLKGVTGAPRKRLLRDHACRLFPSLNPTLKTCDALLLASFHLNNNQ